MSNLQKLLYRALENHIKWVGASFLTKEMIHA